MHGEGMEEAHALPSSVMGLQRFSLQALQSIELMQQNVFCGKFLRDGATSLHVPAKCTGMDARLWRMVGQDMRPW